MDQPSFSARDISKRLLQLPLDNSLALVFPGQGSQKAGMGAAIHDASAIAREVYVIADEAAGFALSELCFNGPDEQLTRTVNAQPAILATSLAILAVALDTGALARRPGFAAGHSLGEYSALVATGVLDFDDAVRVVRQRGRLMEEAGQRSHGTLAAVVGLDEKTVADVCRKSGAEVANYNGPTQTVIGGTQEAVRKACDLAKEAGGRGIAVNVSGAFHTSLMAPAAREFSAVIDATNISDPIVPVVGNLTAHALRTNDQVRADLREQIRAPVRWYQSMNLLQRHGVQRVIEIGPGKVLTAQLKRSNPGLEAVSLDEADALKAATNV